MNRFVTMRKCRTCKKDYPEIDLYYDGVEEEINLNEGQCYGCMIKDAQRIYGNENVILPNRN